MTARLRISIGQHTDRGRRERNQDFHGACIPLEPALTTKGAAFAIADGVSSSDVSQQASQAVIKTFLEDYYCTSQAWSARKSGLQVLMTTNSWLHAQNIQSPYRFEKERGYVCTFSAL